MKLWDAIQQLKLTLKSCSALPDTIGISLEHTPAIHLQPQKDDHIHLHLNHRSSADHPLSSEFIQVECCNRLDINEGDLGWFKLYLPYAFLEYFGRAKKKCFAISHFAQTLDGRIATSSGDSKWIGNEENLLHAHRMRALCDAILVGSKTVERDNPKLTVRLVKGQDPVRIIIGGKTKLSENLHHAVDESTIVFREAEADEDMFDCVVLKKDPYFDLNLLLTMLTERNLYSVYIEGGSFTTSRFLEQKAIDQIQIHFSAKILGSGTNSFGFGQIDSISEAITFRDSKFIPMGDEMMFIGNL